MEDIKNEQGELQEPDYSTISVNLIGVMNTVKLAIWYMKQNCDEGSIVITGSTASMSYVQRKRRNLLRKQDADALKALEGSTLNSTVRQMSFLVPIFQH